MFPQDCCMPEGVSHDHRGSGEGLTRDKRQGWGQNGSRPGVLAATGHKPWCSFLFIWFETGSLYVTQTGLKIVM